jgi:hypothetical protein
MKDFIKFFSREYGRKRWQDQLHVGKVTAREQN